MNRWPYSSGCSVSLPCIFVCRERPSTYVTDAVVEKVDYSDPVFPINEQVEQRNCQPHVDAIADAQPIEVSDDGGVAA